MKQEYTATVKDQNELFAILHITFNKHSNILYDTKTILSKVLKKYDIDPVNVRNLNITQEEGKVLVQMEYSKVNLAVLTKSTDKKEQIIVTLNHLGYPLEKIKNISFQKKWPNCNRNKQKAWFVEIYEHYDPDESYSQQNHERSLSNALSKFLSTDIIVSLY